MATSQDPQDLHDLRVALTCSDRAAHLALEFYRNGFEVHIKDDGSPVTDADPAVERALQGWLAEAVPDDALLGEELGALGDSDRVWILDPIDGTSYFSRQEPQWAVHVVLEVKGRLEVAVVTAPALGVQWWAVRGGGAFESAWPRDGAEKRLAVSSTDTLDEALLDAVNDESMARLPAGVTLAPSSQGWSFGLISLVRGQTDGFLAECCQLWDHAPWILLVEEAGGRFTDQAPGRTGAQRGGLYSNGRIHFELGQAIGYAADQL